MLQPARAELQWKHERVFLTPPAGASEATAVFEFTNTGKTPVSVTGVKADCGCTAMASSAEPVLPGGTGSVRAVFHAASRQGRQTVSITVVAEEPAAREYVLSLDVELKEFVRVTPSFVYWKLGDEPGAKAFRLTLVPGFSFVGAESTTGDFVAEVLTSDVNGVELRVTPRDTWSKHNGTVRITVQGPVKEPLEVLVFARVL